MKRLPLALVCLLSSAMAHAQMNISGNPKSLGVANAGRSVTFVRFRPSKYTTDVHKAVGSGVIVSETQDFHPNGSGNISGMLRGDETIAPSGAFFLVCLYFEGIQFRCANHLFTESGLNLNTSVPLTTSPVAETNPLILQTYPCGVTVVATTWTCTHNFNDQPALVNVFDFSTRVMVPDTITSSGWSVPTTKFLFAQTDTTIPSHTGNGTIATSQPNVVLQNPTGGQSISPSPEMSGSVALRGDTSCKNLSGVRCVDSKNSAGWAGSDVGAWVNAALADTSSGGTVQIAPGSYSLSTQIVLTSNSSVECSPNTSTLTASASLNSSPILASGINHFRIAGCSIDGNRSGNSNQFKLITVSGSSYGEIVGNRFQNNQGGGIYLTSGNSHILIRDNDVGNYGQVLPASIGNEGIALQPTVGGLGNSQVEVARNRVHDGNLGIAVYTSNLSPNISADILIARNRVYSIANDGILIFSSNGTGAKLKGLRIESNETYCNGWPANGTGFSSNCTAGLLQTGSTASSSGVGIDLNGDALIDQPLVIGNHSHDNFFEGIDAMAQSFTTVNCTNAVNSVCTATAGDPFDTSWSVNQVVSINGTNHTLLSVTSTTQLTLTSNTGAFTGMQLAAPNYMRGMLVGNVGYNNGSGNSGTSGSGFSDSAIGNAWIGNVSYNNMAYGFIDQWSSCVTHSGDKAYNNSRRGAPGGNTGFLSQDASNASYLNITAYDSQASPTQTIDVFLSGFSTNNYVESTNIASARVSNSGTNNSFRIGKTFDAGAPCLAGTGSAGTSCLQGNGPGQPSLRPVP
jgi:hypothetical protein